METPDSLHAKVGKPYQRDKILVFSQNRQELEQNGHHQANHSKVWEHEKQNCDRSIFLICEQIKQSCAISSTTNRHMRTKQNN